MFITDSQNSPLKYISDISGNLAYRGQIISGVGGGNSNPTINLTSSASGHYISLLGSGGQTLSSGSLNPIFWTGFQRQNNLIWSNSEPSKLTISGTSEGYYNLSAHINLGINSVFDTYAWVKNGSEILSSNNSSLANVYLSANDYVEYCINSYTGSYISGNCSADIIRIPDVSVINFPNNNTGYLYNDGSGNLSWNKKEYAVIRSTTGGQYISASPPDYVPIIFNSGHIDSNNLFNISNPTKINIKQNGMYIIDSVFSFSVGSYNDRLAIRVNGNKYLNNSNNSTFGYTRKQINTLAYLNSGDYIEAVCYPNNNITLSAPSEFFDWPEIKISNI